MCNINIPKQTLPTVLEIVPNADTILKRGNENLTFSFSLFDRSHKAFNMGNADASWFLSVFDALKEWSKHKLCELERMSIYDAHHISGGAKYDFPFRDAGQYEQYQIRISKTKGRVIGFILGSVFYIVWFDKEHNMTDSSGYPSDIFPPYPLSDYEKLENENSDLKKENCMLRSDLNAAEALLNEKC
jgi:hypothetical protein